MSKILALVGKSGSGKSYIQSELCKNTKYIKIISYTTRKPRSSEHNMIDYYFVNDIVFEIMERKKQFVEVYTAKNGWKYGFAKESFEVGDNIAVAVVTPSGLKQIKRQYNDVFAVYIDCPNEIRYERIKARESNFDEAEFERRKVQDAIDFDGVEGLTDKTIINDGRYKVEEIVSYLKQVIG